MENLQAKPVVKLPGSLNFVLVVRKEDKAITNLKDFIGKKICTLPSPNLGALTLYSMFPNPILQPDFVPVTGGFKDVAIAFNAGKCEGAVLRSSFYHHILSSKFRSKIKVIKESQSFSNQGITLSKRVNHRASEKIFYALTSNNKNKVIKPILDRFGGKSSGFVPAKPEDYKGQNLLKDNLIFGW